MRSDGRLLLTAPWVRAPWLLARRPGVALAIAAAAAVLAVSLASVPLFLSEASNATLHAQLDDACPGEVGGSYGGLLTWTRDIPYFTYTRYGPAPPELGSALLSKRRAQFAAAVDGAPRLSPTETLLTVRDSMTGPHGGRAAIYLLARTGALANVTRLQGDPNAGGLWLPDTLAAQLHARAGDRVTVDGPPQYAGAVSPPAPPSGVRVAGIYRDLRSEPDRAFWCALKPLYRGNPDLPSNIPTLPLVIADGPTFTVLGAALHDCCATQTFEISVRSDGLTTTQARPVVTAVQRVLADLQGDPGHRWTAPSHAASITTFESRATFVATALHTSILPIAVAGAALSLFVAAAAAMLWVHRRRGEIDLLLARGVAPVLVGVKAMLEALPAVLLGAVAGWGLARLLAPVVGPTRLLSRGVTTSAWWLAACAVPLALVTVTVVAALAVRAIETRAHGGATRRAALVPWEVLALAAAAVPLTRLLRSGTSTESPSSVFGSVVHLDAALLAFPLLALAGAVVVVVRAAALLVRRLRVVGDRTRPPVYLALRRLGAAPLMVGVMLAAAALPTATALYGGAATGAVRATLTAQARLVVGADERFETSAPVAVPAALRTRVSQAVTLDQAPYAGQLVTLLAVDPTTFAGVAAWTRSLSAYSLEELMRRVADPAGVTPLPAIVVGASLPDDGVLQLYGRSGLHEIPTRTVARPVGFPVRTSLALVVVDVRAIRHFTEGGASSVFVRGDPAPVLRLLASRHVEVRYASAARTLLDNTIYQPVTYTFDYLGALAVLTGLVGLAATLLYVESRTRARRAGYVLLRDMGLGRLRHLVALVLEFGSVLVTGFAVGCALAFGVVLTVRGRLDLDPSTAPATLLPTPWHAVGATLGVVALVIVVVAAAAQLLADRAHTAEVMREAA